MNFKSAIEHLTLLYKDIEKERNLQDVTEITFNSVESFFTKAEILLRNIYRGESNDLSLMMSKLARCKSDHQYKAPWIRLDFLLDFLDRVGEDIRQKESLTDSVAESEGKSSTSAARDLQSFQLAERKYKPALYITVFILFSYLNFSIHHLLNKVNFKYIIGIEVVIIASVLLFYFKNVPPWLQFLVGTVLAILAIFFS